MTIFIMNVSFNLLAAHHLPGLTLISTKLLFLWKIEASYILLTFMCGIFFPQFVRSQRFLLLLGVGVDLDGVEAQGSHDTEMRWTFTG